MTEKDNGEGVTPLRVEFIARCGMDIYAQNVNVEKNSSVPHVDYSLSRPGKLAVVGGAPSTKDNLEELAVWDGDIWGINDTACWLNSLGIKAALFTVDPGHVIDETLDGECLESVQGAILSSALDPSIFEALKGRVSKFHMSETGLPGGIPGGTNSVGRTSLLALLMGYTEIHYFGFDGSIDTGGHVCNGPYDGRKDQLIVKAGDKTYRTTPEFYLQCQEMSKMIAFHNVFVNRSEGLLKGMIENPDSWEVVAVSEEVKRNIEENTGEESIFTSKYEVAL